MSVDLTTFRKVTAWKRFHKANDVDRVAEYRFNHISDGWIEASIPPEDAFKSTDYTDWEKEFKWLTPVPENRLISRKEKESKP